MRRQSTKKPEMVAESESRKAAAAVVERYISNNSFAVNESAEDDILNDKFDEIYNAIKQSNTHYLPSHVMAFSIAAAIDELPGGDKIVDAVLSHTITAFMNSLSGNPKMKQAVIDRVYTAVFGKPAKPEQIDVEHVEALN